METSFGGDIRNFATSIAPGGMSNIRGGDFAFDFADLNVVQEIENFAPLALSLIDFA